MDYKKIMEQRLKDNPKRIKHILNVQERALELGRLYKADLNVLKIASLLHDITKGENDEFHIRVIKNKRYLKRTPEKLWHARSGAIEAKKLGIKNKKIINAIKYHVYGRKKMSLETLILVIADYTEKDREFEGAKEVYELALKNLYEAYILMINQTFIHLKNRNKKVIKDQIKVYNYIKRRHNIK